VRLRGGLLVQTSWPESVPVGLPVGTPQHPHRPWKGLTRGIAGV